MQIINPLTFVPYREYPLPLFFTAGPIKGGGDWQKKCCELFQQRLGDCTIAVPRRFESTHPMYQHLINGPTGDLDRQTVWEGHYLPRADSHGCVIFWLPEESTTEPRDDGSPYALDTYVAIGRWHGSLRGARPPNVVVGAEDNFPGLSLIRCIFEEVLGTNLVVHPTLEDVVDAAIEVSRRG